MSSNASLFALSDALQLPLAMKGGVLRGSRSASWDCLGLPVQITPSVSKMFIGEQVGVLVHVHGDLNVMVAHYPKTGALSAYVIDGAKTKIDGIRVTPDSLITKNMDLRDAVASLRGAIVAAFYWKRDIWQKLKLPD